MFSTKSIAQAAMIAALYTVLTLIFLPISFGPVQCRISEMLVILPAFMASAVPGVTVGCLITNILGGAVLPDIIFGTLATLIGAVLTRRLTRGLRDEVLKGSEPAGLKFRLLTSIPPIISNTLIVPMVLKYAYMYDDALYFMAFTVFIGELIGIGLLGNIFMSVLLKSGALKHI